MCSSDLRCGGSGHVRDTESSALQILRIIQEEANKDNTAAVHAQVPVEVASFLLNEKRTEIAKIEIKQRISVLLVPNKTLETPNYKLERLKHDDPRLDRIEASYKMAEEFEDPTAVTRRSQEPTNKQTPVIKGVLPDAPAPIVEPKPVAAKPAAAPAAALAHEPASPGFFGWIKKLFGGGEPAPAAAAAPQAKPEAKEDKREGRHGRNGRGRRNDRGSERQERGERNPERSADRASGEGRAERPARGERGQRPARDGQQERRQNDAVNTTATSAEVNGNAAVAEAQPMREDARRERGEGRRERGEGRRERTPRGERPARDLAPLDAANTGLSETAPSTPETLDSAAGEERRERRTRDRYGRDRRGDRPGRESGVAMAPEGDIVIAPVAATPASTPAERVAMPSIQSYTLPVDSLVAVAQAAQLEWVQSDSARVAQIQAAIAAEPKPIHVPRERPPLVVLDEGPLILVETKKDLGQVKMPFDA